MEQKARRLWSEVRGLKSANADKIGKRFESLSEGLCFSHSETDTWLDFALDCGYLDSSDHLRLTIECKQIGAMLGSMLNKPKTFLLPNSDF